MCSQNSIREPLPAAPKLWWSGAAPLAKLAFTDLGSGTTGSLDGLSYLNLTKDYYPWPYVRSALPLPPTSIGICALSYAACTRTLAQYTSPAYACVAYYQAELGHGLQLSTITITASPC